MPVVHGLCSCRTRELDEADRGGAMWAMMRMILCTDLRWWYCFDQSPDFQPRFARSAYIVEADGYDLLPLDFARGSIPHHGRAGHPVDLCSTASPRRRNPI